MKHETELTTAASEGFRKWLTNNELLEYIEQERARISRTPTLFLVAFNTHQGYVKFEANVVKLTKEIDEAGKLLDVELHVVNDDITEPIKLMSSAFQPDAHPAVPFCRIFPTQKDRDSFYEDIRFMAELASVYRLSEIEFIKRKLGY